MFITRRLTLALALLLIFALPAAAGDFTELYGNALQQEKPIALSTFKGNPLLIVFWRSDCAPCLAEMDGLFAAAHAHPPLQIALISLEDAASARKHLRLPLPANLHALVARSNTARLLATYGDGAAMLPFSRFQRAGGSVCATHAGLLGTDRIEQWMASC